MSSMKPSIRALTRSGWSICGQWPVAEDFGAGPGDQARHPLQLPLRVYEQAVLAHDDVERRPDGPQRVLGERQGRGAADPVRPGAELDGVVNVRGRVAGRGDSKRITTAAGTDLPGCQGCPGPRLAGSAPAVPSPASAPW